MPRSHLKTNFFSTNQKPSFARSFARKNFKQSDWLFTSWGAPACVTVLSLYSQNQNKKFPVKIKLQKFFMIWISKSWILELWRWMKFILLGIYFDIISNSNNPGSKHLIERSTFKNYKWNFFSFDITKVAWLFFLPS